MADDFIRKIARGEIPGLSIDPGNPMLTYENADIYSAGGTRVRYLGMNGYTHDLEWANKHLIADAIYTIERTDVGGWHTDFFLKEVPGKAFNSVHFAAVPSEDRQDNK